MDDLEAIETLAAEIEGNSELDKLSDLRAVILANPRIRRLYTAAAVRCLGARRVIYDKKEGALHFEPDGVAIMRAVTWLGSYDAGLPAQTTIALQVGNGKELTVAEAVAQSPALLAKLRRDLETAEKATPRHKPRRVQPVIDAEEAPQAAVA